MLLNKQKATMEEGSTNRGNGKTVELVESALEENTSLSGFSEKSVTGPVQANRNEEIHSQASEIDFITAIRQTELHDDCYKQYLKEVPQQWEPLNNLNRYKDYVDLYEKRYNCYMSIRKVLEKIIEEFKELKKTLDKAKHDKNRDLFDKVIQSTRKNHAEVENIYCSRRKAYMILHKELNNLKRHILRFYEENSNIMDSSMSSLTQY